MHVLAVQAQRFLEMPFGGDVIAFGEFGKAELGFFVLSVGDRAHRPERRVEHPLILKPARAETERRDDDGGKPPSV